MFYTEVFAGAYPIRTSQFCRISFFILLSHAYILYLSLSLFLSLNIPLLYNRSVLLLFSPNHPNHRQRVAPTINRHHHPPAHLSAPLFARLKVSKNPPESLK